MFQKTLLRMLGCLSAIATIFPIQTQAYDACYDYCCDPCSDYLDRFWFSADYLYWQIQDSPKIIPLVIEQPVVNGPFDVVLGDKKIKNDWHSGGRFEIGYWFDSCKNLGGEINYFFLGTRTNRSKVTSDENGVPRLRVPFFNVFTGLPDSVALATPGIFRGSAFLKVSDSMQGAELNLVGADLWGCPSNVKFLAGFRYWNYEDKLVFFANSPFIPTPTIYNNRDKFSTQNNFYGAQLGIDFSQQYCSFFFDIRGKIALGAMCQQSTIRGRFQTNEFTGSLQTFEGGYFALPTNIGKHKKTRFAVIPEINLNVGYLFTDCFALHVGYTFLYASHVARAPKQITNRINPTQSANLEFNPTPVLEGAPLPTGKIKSSSLWTQGANVGIDLIF